MRHLYEAAVARRSQILGPETDAVRLIDGEGDGLTDVILETFSGRLLLSTTTGRVPQPLLDLLRNTGSPTYSKQLDQHQKENPSHLCGPEVTEPFLIRENGLNFEISFQSGYSQGIFLDQRNNRAELRRLMDPGLRLLNTFAYTGAFSVAAASAGAETTTLDLSQTYLDWAKRNFAHNALDPGTQHFCKGDTFHWLRRFAKQGKRFDGIVLDPPTFSRDEKGKVFRVEKDFGELVALAMEALAEGGFILCCTNFRGLGTHQFKRQLRDAAGRPVELRETAMPADFTDAPYLKSIWLRI